MMSIKSRKQILTKMINDKMYTTKEIMATIDAWTDLARQDIATQVDFIIYLEGRRNDVHNTKGK